MTAHHTPAGTIVIEAESHFPSVSVVVNHLDLVERKQHILRPEHSYRLDLCITPRLPSRMRFQRWAPNRFERPGRLFIVPPGEILGIENAIGRESVVVCNLLTDVMLHWLGGDVELRNLSLESALDVSSKAIAHLMLRVADEIRHPGFASEIVIEALAMQIAVELQRHCRQTSAGKRSGGLASWRLRRIEERVRSAEHPPSLSELAILCGLSVRQLSRGFQASCGLPLGQYVANHRIDRARHALATGRSVKAVAYDLGFNSSAAFCSAFRKATGITPSTFRRLTSAGK